jgi:hypothetical protein
MTSDVHASITQWLDGVKHGDSLPALQLYDAVYDRLLRLAKLRLKGRALRWADEEDVAGLSHEWWALKEERTLIVRRINHGRASNVYA